jgi:hypothetical protein
MSYIRQCVLATALISACTSPDKHVSPTVSDSLGVALITYAGTFATSPGRSWSTEPEPLLAINLADPALYQVRTALFQGDGSIVVANGGSHQLLLFDRAGVLHAFVGGKGGGPGEFLHLTSVSIGRADSLLAYDQGERRLSVFDRGGAYVRAVTLRGLDTLGNAEAVGALRSGEIVGAFTFDPSGEPASRFAVFPHVHTHWGPHDVPGSNGPMVMAAPVAFSSMTALGIADTFVYVALPERVALARVDRNGVRRITRQDAQPRPITESDRERLFAALATGRISPQELDMIRKLDGPTTLPAFGFEPLSARYEQTVLVTDASGVWLRPFQFPDDTAGAVWPGFNANGYYEGTVSMPPRFRPTAVNGDIVLGVYQDSLDVESVRAYRVVERR